MDSRKTRRSTSARVRRAVIADAAAATVVPLPISWTRLPGVGVSHLLVAWDRGQLPELPAGHTWDVVQLPAAEGWETVRRLHELRSERGPALHTPAGVDVFVQPGSADDWDLPRVSVFRMGATVEVPHPSVVAPHTMCGCSWIVPPTGAQLTNTAALHEVYAAVTEARSGRT